MKGTFLLMVSVILVSFLSSCNKAAKDNHIIDVNKSQATKILAEEEITVIDVRTPGEYQRGHVEGAILINFNENGFQEKIAALDPSKSYLVYCHSGGRSSGAVKVMSKLGFTKVYHLYHGASGGLPTR